MFFCFEFEFRPPLKYAVKIQSLRNELFCMDMHVYHKQQIVCIFKGRYGGVVCT